MPKRSSRPSRVGRLAHAVELLGHLRGRLAPGQVDVGVRARRPRAPPATSRRSRSAATAAASGTWASSTWMCSPVEVERARRPRRRARSPGTRRRARSARPWRGSRRSAAARSSSPPTTTFSSSRPPETRWYVAAICAASVGREAAPGRNATRNFSRSVTWVSAGGESPTRPRTSEPVGVSAASKPELLGRARDLRRGSRRRRARWPGSASRARGAAPTASPWLRSLRESPVVGRNQCRRDASSAQPPSRRSTTPVSTIDREVDLARQHLLLAQQVGELLLALDDRRRRAARCRTTLHARGLPGDRLAAGSDSSRPRLAPTRPGSRPPTATPRCRRST